MVIEQEVRRSVKDRTAFMYVYMQLKTMLAWNGGEPIVLGGLIFDDLCGEGEVPNKLNNILLLIGNLFNDGG